MRTRHHEDGFTLFEMVVVVVVLGLIAAIAIPAFLGNHTSPPSVSTVTGWNKTSDGQESRLLKIDGTCVRETNQKPAVLTLVPASACHK